MQPNPESILGEPYWRLNEIIALASNRRFGAEADVHESEEFRAIVLKDLREAILRKSLMPLDMTGENGWTERYKTYLEPTFTCFVALSIIALSYWGQKLINSHPELRSEFKPGTDTSHVFHEAFFRLATIMFGIGGICWVTFLAYKAFRKYTCRSPRDRFNYLLSDIKFRGLHDNVFIADNVIDFLNARYSLKIEQDPFRVWKQPFFRRNGEYWIAGYAGKVVCLRDGVANEVLAALLNEPHQDFNCLAFEKGDPDSVDKIKHHAAEKDSGFVATIAKLDKEGVDADFIDRSIELLKLKREQAMEDATSMTVADELESQIDQLERYRARTFTKAGKLRVQNDATAAAARQKKRFQRLIDDLKAIHPVLSNHLNQSVKTGSILTYRPPEEIHWDVRF